MTWERQAPRSVVPVGLEQIALVGMASQALTAVARNVSKGLLQAIKVTGKKATMIGQDDFAFHACK